MRLLFAAVMLGAASMAGSAPPAAAPPATVAESAGRRFIEAFNAPLSIERFIADNFTQVSLSREGAAQRALSLDRLRAAAGGLSVIEIKKEGERGVEMIAATRDGGRHARIVLFTSGREPGKIADVFLLDARDPRRAARDAFPTTRQSDDEIARLVRRRIDALAGEDRFSGAVLLARGDRVLVREARGMADHGWRIANRTSTRFHIASVGKMWTAVAVLRLAEQGKLSLDDTVARWVPTYPHRDAAARITLRMLLQHRGGIGEWDGRRLGALTPAQAAATMTAAPGEPGKAFGYSNAGYVLLAAAAEAASGRPFDRLLSEQVFAPAGMTRSGLWPVTAIVPDRATGYLRPAEDSLGFGPRFANDQFLGHGGDGSGGGYSTVDDMLAFHRALANGKLLKPATLRMMIEQAGEFPGAPRPARYGLGLNLTDCAGVPTLGHGGGGQNSGVSSVTYATLDGSWTVIALSNFDPPAAEELAADMCDLVHRR